MTFKEKNSTDGTRRLIDNVSGNTVRTFYPTEATSGGRMKILTAASTISAADNGTVFFLNSSTEFATTLPAPFLGGEFSFVVKAAPVGASYTIVSGSSANIIKGMQLISADAAADTGTADDTITFADGQAVPGDRVDLWSDGTYWYAWANTRVAAGLTFTQAST